LLFLKKTGVWLLLLAFTGATVFCDIPVASAQGITALGKIRASGRTLLRSSDGRWAPAGPSYPLLRHTAIKTEDGVTVIYLRDGSRVSLSKGSSAVVDGVGRAYAVSLRAGTMAFNVNPSTSLLVVTPSANISVNMNDSSIVRKASYNGSGWVSGMIFVGEKGTEVRGISGRVIINAGTKGAVVVSAGESVVIGADKGYKVYKVQAFSDEGPGPDQNNHKKKKRKVGAFWIWQSAAVTGFVGTGVVLGLATRGTASPTCPQAPCQ
jgi:hypothetical protein